MSRQEFLDTLRRVLARELSESEVADNINYYWNYIEQEIAAGKSEEEVLRSLGDPRLIAKTILQVDQKKEDEEDDAGRVYRETVYAEDGDGGYRSEEEEYADPFYGAGSGMGGIHVRKWKAGDWVKLALVVLVVFLVLGTIFHILWSLLPFMLVTAAVLWVYRKITGRR